MPSSAHELGPVVPWHPPSTFGHTTKNRLVSIGTPRADERAPHHPGLGWPGSTLRPRASRHSRHVGPRSHWTTTRVELAPGLICHRHAVEATAGLEAEGGLSRSPAEQRDESATAGIVARPPGPGDRGIGHGGGRFRRPWRSGSPPRGRRGCPRASRGLCRAGPGPR